MTWSSFLDFPNRDGTAFRQSGRGPALGRKRSIASVRYRPEAEIDFTPKRSLKFDPLSQVYNSEGGRIQMFSREPPRQVPGVGL